MTTEEKARAYDEALERARKIHNKIVNEELLGFPGQIEDIFPELRKEEKPLTSFQQCLNCILRGVYYAEVPDEKVNEFILNVVRTRTDELIKLAKKQEEQKHPDGCFTCDEYKKGYEAGRLNGFTAGYNKAMKEVEQKEQKPAWSEEDEKIIDTIVSVLGQYIDYKAESGTNSGFAFATPRYSKEIDWLNSLRPQPKQEWSKDDYHWEGLKELLRDYQKTIDRQHNNMAYESVELYIDWIDSLFEQPVDELEEEIATWIPSHIKCEKDPHLRDVIIKWAGFVARHFAEWGAEHLKR